MKEDNRIEQWFSKWRVHQNHFKGLLKHRIAGARPQSLSNSVGLGWSWKFAFLTSYQMTLMLLICGHILSITRIGKSGGRVAILERILKRNAEMWKGEKEARQITKEEEASIQGWNVKSCEDMNGLVCSCGQEGRESSMTEA